MQKTSKSKDRFLGVSLAFVLSFVSAVSGFPIASYAEENVVGPSGTGYTKSRWDKLMDNTLEYDEVPDLVHEFNMNIAQTWDKLKDTQKDMNDYIQDLESRELEIKNLRDSAKDKKKNAAAKQDMVSYVEAATDEASHNIQLKGFSYGNMTVPGFSGILASLKKSANAMLISKSTVNKIKKGENQVTMVAQQLLITYDSLLKQKDILDVMAKMYEEQYQIALNKQKLGMATDMEVYEAQVNQLSASSMSASLQNGLLQLKPTICTLTGWAANADPEIAPIPEIDLSVMDEINLEVDIPKAIGNNSNLQTQRHSEKGKTMDGVTARLGYINEGEQRMAVKMQNLYDDILSKRTAYEAAKDGYEAAMKEKDQYARMYDLGYLSRSDYLGTQISVCQAQADYQSACTALRLAIETYGWAVKGLVNAD